MDLLQIEERLKELDDKFESSTISKRKNALLQSLEFFLSQLSRKCDISNCTPVDLKRFLIWKDNCGKTKVHGISCKYLGTKEGENCDCPRRLAAGTVSVMVQNLVDIFDKRGYGRVWNGGNEKGNPAAAPCIKEYLKMIHEEQAAAHVVPKQAKPIFLGKLKMIVNFIDRELARSDISVRERYILLRDQAWFKLQFFGGDRANDLAMLVVQEVKLLDDGTGIAIKQTFGKTLRGGKQKCRVFVVKRCKDEVVCPVEGLFKYTQGCKNMGVDITNGFIFRIVTERGRVMNQNVSYSVMYDRLINYLTRLGIYEGETPHSFRAGCAVTLALSGSVDNIDQMMNHIGWYGEGSAEYYSRLPVLVESDFVAGRLAESVGNSDLVESQFQHYGEFGKLRKAFS